jgi:uncharacterized protein (DUF58 family)
VRTLQTSPLATTVRPWAPGDSFNRIHWKSTARHNEIQVKEFDLEQTADAWIILDLDRTVQTGRGDESTAEAAIRVAASVTDKALAENRAVGMTVNAHRLTILPADRGGRQRLKILQMLAAVEADGSTPLGEALIASIPRLRRGMAAIVVTASQDPGFIRPLAGLRSRGISTVVVLLDPAAYARIEREAAEARGEHVATPLGDADGVRLQRARALRHALAEYELATYTVGPGRALGEALAR